MSSLYHPSHKGFVRLSLLCLPLLVALVVLASCGQPSFRPTQVSTPTGVTQKAVPFERLQMLTATTGWAITSDPSLAHRILHTQAGVKAWQDVTPRTAGQLSTLSATVFFDPVTAWLSAGSTLYRTHDAGSHWEQSQVPDQGTVTHLFFLTQQLGWLLVEKAAFTGNMTVDLLRTTDGGASWKIISVSNTPPESNPTALPFQGTKSGPTFVNPTTGWVTGFTNTPNVPLLYITHDNGASWQHQEIALPNGAFQVTTIPPTFFNDKDGALPVIIPGASSQTVNLYITHDAGAHWNPTTAVPSPSFADNISMVDPMHSFIASNTFATNSNQYLQSTVSRTSDGGLHWTSSDVKLKADIVMINFVSPTLGWAIDSLHTLYQTTDSGRSWLKV